MYIIMVVDFQKYLSWRIDSVLISKFVGLDMVTILNLAQNTITNTGSNWFIFTSAINYIYLLVEKNQLIMIS